MDKIARIRQEIERRKGYISVTHFAEELLSFLDTLSEEPNKGLEEAAEEYTQQMLESWRFDSTGCRPLREPFIAGAEWQASQMPMPEDTVLFQKGVAEGRRLEREDMMKDAEECELYYDGDFLSIDLNMAALGYSERDKVRIVVLKAEEE